MSDMTNTESPTPPVGQTISASDVALLRAGDWLMLPGGREVHQHDGSFGVPFIVAHAGWIFLGRPIDADGWIAHHGGENPAPGLEVEYRVRSGSTFALAQHVAEDELLIDILTSMGWSDFVTEYDQVPAVRWYS